MPFFALSVMDPRFVDLVGSKINVSVPSFVIPEARKIEGCIIRCSQNGGEYIIGCRMPRDIEEVADYVNRHI